MFHRIHDYTYEYIYIWIFLCVRLPNERERWVKELRKAIGDESHRRKSFADMERYSAILRDPETRSK